MTKKDKQNVLDGCHCAELGGGHFGRDKTLSKIAERFYCPGMVDDMKEFCKTCDKLVLKSKQVYLCTDTILCICRIHLFSLCVENLRLLQSSTLFL